MNRLAAILAADVVNYTRLMEKDTDGTVAAWRAARSDIIDPGITAHSGRIVKHTGDGFLAEFATVQAAVKCAVAMQQDLRDGMLDFRMGVNLGDIVDDGEDIHGEGVNVAARLEALAEPGGICVSGDVYNQVRNRMDCPFEDMGERTVKNVSAPVRVYRVLIAAPAKDTIMSAEAVVDLSIPIEGFGGRPAVAVLPFDNMSGDPEQEFFADGLTEDLILRLSHWKWFPVIARNSTFIFKGQAVDIQEVGEKLGASYVIEGSIRRAGNRVRVAVQLIDATNGHHVWAERYDRDIEDIFEAQDELTDHIVAALDPAIGEAEQERARMGRPENLDAWEICQRAFWHFYRGNREDHETSKTWFKKSIELDPNLAMAWGGLAFSYYTDVVSGWTTDVAKTVDDMLKTGQRAIAISDTAVRGHLAVGLAQVHQGHHDAGIREMQRAVELNPSFAQAHSFIGVALVYAGRPEEAIVSVGRALRLSPRDSLIGRMLSAASFANQMAGNHELAVEMAEKAVARLPNHPLTQRALVMSLGSAGRTDEAKAAMAELLRLVPDYSIQRFRASMPFKNSQDSDRVIAILHDAGLPELTPQAA